MAESLGFADIEQVAQVVRAKSDLVPEIGIILGSGLGAFAEWLEAPQRLAYAELPHFPVPQVSGHAGELVLGRHHGRRLAVMSGRVHHYEGHPLAWVTLTVRVLARLGAKKLIVTNAAGGVNPSFAPGDLMAIADHVNMTGLSPLRGSFDARLGPRFPDMTEAYSVAGRAAWHAAADKMGLKLHDGIYMGVAGPSYETPAEVRMLRQLGGDAVGMSTVAEVIAARHASLEVAGLSVITNHAAGIGHAPLSHGEVTAVANKARQKVCELLSNMVQGWI